MLEVNVDNVRVYDAKNALVASSKYDNARTAIGTGYRIQLVSGDAVLDEIVVCLIGDFNSDGKVTAADYNAVKTAVVNKTTDDLDPAYTYAADVNKDGKVTAADYKVIKDAVVNKTNLS